MTIPAGTRLGGFEIVSLLGAGGMGQVYCARDTKLGRNVALKLLPDFVARDEEQLQRLEREAYLLASLNHPNIATLHGLDEFEGRRFLVMELVEGETLAGKILRRALGLRESLSLFLQIADALEAAHEKGIIHRDLKPANVKITHDGKVKLLDFGLAKAVSEEKAPADLSQSPTLAREGTEHGVILGTAAYMSPEQARGEVLDRKTDIWSFGCVLYEALTGRKAFPGKTISDTIASILAREPDWTALSQETPEKVRGLLCRCLQKEPQRRLRDIGDARIEIEESLAEPSGALPTTAAPRRHRWAPWTLAILASAVALWALLRPAPWPTRTVMRFALDLPPEQALTHLKDPSVALSPDGKQLVYNAGGKLYLRPIDQLEATPISGTDGAMTAFFSPDGQWVGFYGFDGKLKKVRPGGGSPVILCDAPDTWGASWGDDDTILFTPTQTSGLARISGSGGSPSVVTKPDPSQGEIAHWWPEFLPGGKAALFTLWKGAIQNSQIELLRLDTGEHRVLLQGGSNARFAPSGHIVYARGGRLMAAPFDLENLRLKGEPVPILEGVLTQGTTGAAHFSLSLDGSLAYVPSAVPPERTLVWVDRRGQSRLLTETRRAYAEPRLSPDGRRLALRILSDDGAHIWFYDLERDGLTRLSSSPVEGFFPVWTPDGTRITFRSGSDIVWQATDGSGAPETLTRGTNAIVPNSWSPDGSVLAFVDIGGSRSGIWLLSADSEGKPRPFLQTPADERGGAISPDGRWIAYVSDESGRFEVYLRPFPGPGGKWQVSTNGGAQPAWARSGREIFYRIEELMMAVAVETEPSFHLSKPRLLFEGRFVTGPDGPGFASYDVAPDGEHFVMIRSEKESPPTRIHLALNWAEELKARVPPARR